MYAALPTSSQLQHLPCSLLSPPSTTTTVQLDYPPLPPSSPPSTTANTAIICSYINVSVAQEAGSFSLVSASSLLLACALTSLLHLVSISFNALCCRLLRLQPSHRKSFICVASTKSLPVSITMINLLPQGLGQVHKHIPFSTSHHLSLTLAFSPALCPSLAFSRSCPKTSRPASWLASGRAMKSSCRLTPRLA